MIRIICIFVMWLTFSGVVMGFTIPPTLLFNNSEIKNSIMNTEIFKDVKGYEGLYQVSNYGNVKSLSRQSNDAGRRLLPEKILKPQLKGAGYYSVVLYRNGVSYQAYIHRLVAIHFISGYDNHKEVNHKDGNKNNNNVNNLEWVTHRENMTHGFSTGLINARYWAGVNRENNPRSKPVIQMSIDNEYIKEFDSIKSASEELKINSSCICWCCKGKLQHSKGFKFKYK